MRKLFSNIGQLVQVRNPEVQLVSGLEMKNLPVLEDAFMIVNKGLIELYGHMKNLPENSKFDQIIDCSQKVIIPSWCDSHTHLVYGDDRHEEFIDRIRGLSYKEIADKGGGILNSAKKLQLFTEDELFEKASKRLSQAIANGTGAIEIKSGYGLTTDTELKMLRVIKRLKQRFEIPIKATFLGAHAMPKAYQSQPDQYIKVIIDDMLPVIAKEKLADFIDVFCEVGYFTPLQMDQLLKAGKQYGLTPKVHVNQFNSIGGIEVALENRALSVDHLEVLSDQEIAMLRNSQTIPIALPLCSLFLEIPYTPARKIIDSGLPLAIASDYNPGTAPSSNLNLAFALSCIKMKITPEEAINALTLNAAYAMDVVDSCGSICVGKSANFNVYHNIKSFRQIPYYFGNQLIEQAYINGESFSVAE